MFILLIISIIAILLIVGYHCKSTMYECVYCKCRFKIGILRDIFSFHNTNYKYLKCPRCKRRGWHKEL